MILRERNGGAGKRRFERSKIAPADGVGGSVFTVRLPARVTDS